MTCRAVILAQPGWVATPTVEAVLRGEGVAVERRSSVSGALVDASQGLIDAFFLLAPASQGATALVTISRIRATHRSCRIVLVAECPSTETVLAAFRCGADDVVPPAPAEALRDSLGRLGLAGQAADSGVGNSFSFGSSRVMQEIEGDARRAALSDSTVMITGQTGTGKELAARFIHDHSSRRKIPMLSINCAAIPEALLESELFGHDKGAFTGAVRNQLGIFELAAGGTVFLDEIGELALPGQVKLLRALESRCVRPLGGQRERPVDVRVIAATNQNLERRVERQEFRPDLYYRLNVIRLDLPPLRDRREDLPDLVRYHLRQLCRQMSRPAVKLSGDLMSRLFEYEWPGNIRELRNFLESALVHTAGDVIDTCDAPRFVRDRLYSTATGECYEKSKILSALTSAEWNKSRAAGILHCSRMTLYRKMARYGIADSRSNTLQPLP